MKLRRFHAATVDEKERSLHANFVGALDLPSLSAAVGGDKFVVAGWISPKSPHNAYTLRIESAGREPVSLAPAFPRPDVARKLGFSPLAGDSVFKGFHCEIAFAEHIRLFVVMDGLDILWKDLHASEVDVAVEEGVRSALAYGYTRGGGLADWSACDRGSRRQGADFVLGSVEIRDQDATGTSAKIAASEREAFSAFLEQLAAPDFLSVLLTRKDDAGRVLISAPFSASPAVLIGSFFLDINYLVFEADGKRFYLGQYLHTADFVYFPERALCVRVRWSLYNPAHLKALIVAVAENPERFSPRVSQPRPTEVGGVIVNGVSPYHFFYDCLPALHVANALGRLGAVTTYHVLSRGCYLPLNEILATPGVLQDTPAREMARISAELNPRVFILAGVSYRALGEGALEAMDAGIVEAARPAGETPRVIAELQGLAEHFPIFWVGISAQKRAWVNQEPALVRTLAELRAVYPRMAVVFDGMTSNIFDTGGEQAQFDADHAIVARIAAQLPLPLKVVDLVGCGSAEKLRLAGEVDFFIANYSTGSMYPARFHHVPGVAHLSNALMKAVRDIHVHHETLVLPAELVVDIPDPACPRLDFVSYSIDEAVFAGLVTGFVGERLAHKSGHLPATQA